MKPDEQINWYYVNAGQSVGPVSQSDFDGLVSTGTIQPETLVWHEGMANWVSWREVQRPPGTSLRAVPPPMAELAVKEVVCAECGKIFPAESVIRIGATSVCAACKPVYVQKLREGVSATGAVVAMEYGGFWIRLLAKILDSLIIGGVAAICIGILAGILIPLGGRNRDNQAVFGLFVVAVLLVLFLGVMLFPVWCNVKYGGTPGKRILHLRVVTATGNPITWGRGFGRFFAEILNGLIPFSIGYIIAAFDSQKRAVHDHIAGTRVIKE
jgi:uncharacterized RDD family membrane protein YckC